MLLVYLAKCSFGGHITLQVPHRVFCAARFEDTEVKAAKRETGVFSLTCLRTGMAQSFNKHAEINFLVALRFKASFKEQAVKQKGSA